MKPIRNLKSEKPRPKAIKLTGSGAKIELRALLFVLQEQMHTIEGKKSNFNREYSKTPDKFLSLGNRIANKHDNSPNSRFEFVIAYEPPNEEKLSPQYLLPPNETSKPPWINQLRQTPLLSRDPPPPEKLSLQYLFPPNSLLRIEPEHIEIRFGKTLLSPQYLHPPNEATADHYIDTNPPQPEKLSLQYLFSPNKLTTIRHEEAQNHEKQLSPQYLHPPNEASHFTQVYHLHQSYKKYSETATKISQELSPQYLFPPNIFLCLIVALNILQYYFLIVSSKKSKQKNKNIRKTQKKNIFIFISIFLP